MSGVVGEGDLRDKDLSEHICVLKEMLSYGW